MRNYVHAQTMATTTVVKAARLYGNKDVRIEHVLAPTAPLTEGEVRIAPAWVGICGTDVNEYFHGPVGYIPFDFPY
jgi:(R,R)-butanediol dehydrogenase/meso-butanediol dehydrogenase/diacetyl reductase